MQRRSSQHVVITGASAGAGRAAAMAFARRGWSTTLLARGRGGLQAACADVERLGGRALAVPADVADPDAVEAAAGQAESQHGPIDVWVNCAMITVFGPVAAVTAEEYRRVTEVTYLGQVHGTMSALKRMRLVDDGTIVNVGSSLAYHGLPLQAAYCGAKAAAKNFTESLRSELIHEGSRVRLSYVVLPALDTPQFDWARSKLGEKPRPVPPVYDPEVAGEAIFRAARSAPRELMVASSSVEFVGGSAVAPGYLDRKLAAVGWSGQLTGESAKGRPDNLFAPLDDDVDFGMRGRFAQESRPEARVVITGGLVRGLAGAAAMLPFALAVAGLALSRLVRQSTPNFRGSTMTPSSGRSRTIR